MGVTKTIETSRPIPFKHWHYITLLSGSSCSCFLSKLYIPFFFTICMLHATYLSSSLLQQYPVNSNTHEAHYRSFYIALFLPPLTPNIPLTALLSQTLKLYSSFDIRHQISHPHKTTQTPSILHNLTVSWIQITSEARNNEYLLNVNNTTKRQI
jgi:hypothetical protein